MMTNVKRLLIVGLFLVGTSFATISPASAGQFCADGTWSNSSGRGTCSWHGGILGNTTKKKTNTFSDPWGTSLNNDPFGTTKRNTFSDPWGNSNNKLGGFCTSFDRSMGRC